MVRESIIIDPLNLRLPCLYHHTPCSFHKIDGSRDHNKQYIPIEYKFFSSKVIEIVLLYSSECVESPLYLKVAVGPTNALGLLSF